MQQCCQLWLYKLTITETKNNHVSAQSTTIKSILPTWNFWKMVCICNEELGTLIKSEISSAWSSNTTLTFDKLISEKTRFYRRLPLSQQFWFPFFCYIMKCYNSQPKHFHHAMLQKLRHFLCSSFKSNSGTKNQQRFSNDMKKFKTIDDSTRCIKLFPQHDFRFNISVNVTLA